jgi:hypothetical protein
MTTILKTQLEAALGNDTAFATVMTDVAKLPVRETIASPWILGRSKKQAIGVIWQRQRKLTAFVNEGPTSANRSAA